VFGVLLQDWTTVHVTGTASVTQSELLWLDVGDFRDIVFWLETRGVLVPLNSIISIYFETSPTKDEGLFQSVASASGEGMSNLAILRALEVNNVALSKWVRWRLAISPTPGTEWGATFRIHCSLNRNRGS